MVQWQQNGEKLIEKEASQRLRVIDNEDRQKLRAILLERSNRVKSYDVHALAVSDSVPVDGGD